MFFEAVQALFSLDLLFFIEIFMENLLWVFMFIALMYFFFDGKRTIYFSFLFVLVMWAWADLEPLTGLVWTSAFFLLFYYLSKIALIGFTESSPSLKKYTIIISTLQFYILFLIFNFFLK